MESKTLYARELKWLLCEIGNALEKKYGSGPIQVTENFYWIIPEENLCDMTAAVSELEVGSFWDDIDFFRIAIKNNEFPSLLLSENILHLARHLALSKISASTIPSRPAPD